MDSAPVPIAQSKHDRYIVAHGKSDIHREWKLRPLTHLRHAIAVLGSVATLITMPIALLAGRYLRTWRYWNGLHAVANGLTVILIIVTFALGNAALKDPNQYFGPHSDSHHKLGLAVLLIVVLQGFAGLAAKMFTRAPSYNYVTLNKRRSIFRFIHILFGIATAGILCGSEQLVTRFLGSDPSSLYADAQIVSGFQEWDDTSDSQTTTPRGIRIAFWVLFAIEVALYLAGWPIMEYLGRRKMNREMESDGLNGEKRRASTAQLVA